MRKPPARVWRAALVLAMLLVLSFGVVAPPESCPSVGAGDLRRSAQAAVDWFVRNQRSDGTWLYLYDADEDSAPSEYNEVRHAGAAMGLYRAAAAGLPGALRSGDRGTQWELNRLVRRDGWAALELDGRVTTGATALMVAGLVIRRDATGDTRYDGVLRRLGRFLLAQTEPSGAVLASYDPARGAPVAGEYSKYYTGEAYGVSETVDFPERGRPPLTEDEVGYARRQAELFGVQARWLGQRYGPWGGLVRGPYEPRGGWYGVIGEALSGWWLTAQQDPRLAGLQGSIAERATSNAGLAVRAQSDAEDAANAARPERVQGAWFRDGETRMDDQQHALAGLLRTIPIIEAAEGSSSGAPGDDMPSGWLWAAALVLALNPARAAFGVPRAGRSPRSVAGLSAAGGVIGGLAVCAAATAGGPLLEALDVSEPSFRIAAGVLAGL